MSEECRMQFELRLRDLSARIAQKIEEYQTQGPAHGAAREEAANWQLEHMRISQAAQSDQKAISELAADLEALKLAFERGLARIDKQARA